MSKSDKTLDESAPDPDKEWEEMIAGMSDEELTAWARHQNKAAEVRDKWLLDSDEGFEDMMARMTDDERIAYLREQCEAMLDNPDLFSEVPPEVLQEMKAGLKEYDKANEECKIAEQNAKIAVARRDSMIDAMLTELPPDDEKGH